MQWARLSDWGGPLKFIVEVYQVHQTDIYLGCHQQWPCTQLMMLFLFVACFTAGRMRWRRMTTPFCSGVAACLISLSRLDLVKDVQDGVAVVTSRRIGSIVAAGHTWVNEVSQRKADRSSCKFPWPERQTVPWHL